MVSKSLGGKGRAETSRAFGSPAPSGFGRFSTQQTSAGSLSYLSDPPDFASISDSNIVVSFKNLLKKDNTTKYKALTDLLQYTRAHPHEQDGGVEDAVIEAWVHLYPRTSIDNDRRVRELSHSLQFELLKSARKRMERTIPKVAGAWLAGIFDRDKPVARSATEGLSTFLNTEDKVTQFWRKCQPQILEYATEAVVETPDTLSDERSTKPEDAEAKYYRVISGSFSLVLGLLQRLSIADTEKYLPEYEKFFSSGPGHCVWSFATADDSRARKTLYQLLLLCLDQRKDLLEAHMPRLAKVLTSEALKKNQTGSATDLVSVLTKMTQNDGQFWGTKKSPLARLRSFVEKGSQGSSHTFWNSLNELLAVIPSESISPEGASEFFKSFRTGLSRREEPRTNAPYAWSSYLDTVSRILPRLEPESQVQLVTTDLFPLTEHYLLSAERQVEWSVGINVSILSKAYFAATSNTHSQVKDALAKEWDRLADIMVSRLVNSLPEVSKEFENSQNKIAEDGKRWFSLVGAIHSNFPTLSTLSKDEGLTTPDYTEAACWKIIHNAADLLKRRNYKPFSAATIVLLALQQAGYLFDAHDANFWMSVVPANSDEEMAKLLSSPSAVQIISCIVHLGRQRCGHYQTLWSATVRCLLELEDNPCVNMLITKLISDDSAKPLSQDNSDLQDHIREAILATAESKGDSWDLFDAALEWEVLPSTMLRDLSATIVETLGSEDQSSMKAIELLLKKSPGLFSEDEKLHMALVAKLLGLMELNDSSVSPKASQLRSLLETHADAQPSVLNIIQENLERPGPNSLGIDILVQQAITMFNTTGGHFEHIFPNTNIWMQELQKFLQLRFSQALALTSELGGAYFLPRDVRGKLDAPVIRDQRGLSIPARMAIYTTSVLSHGQNFDSLPQKLRAELLYLLYISAEIISDQITLMEDNKLFETLNNPSILLEAEEFVTATRKIMNNIFAQSKKWQPGKENHLLDELVSIMIQQARDLNPTGVYSARALSEVLQSFADVHSNGSLVEDWISSLDILKATPATVLPAVAFLTGYGEVLAGSKAVINLLNSLISDVAALDPKSDNSILELVLLVSCASVFEPGYLPVANNRLVFAIKQITSWFEYSPQHLGPALSTESCRALQRLFPCIREVYGPYWEQTITFCLSLWAHAPKDEPEQRLPVIHATVKLLSSLKSIEDPNDDLVDALESHAGSVYQGLLDLLKLSGPTNSQPQEIVDALLCREATKIPLEHLKDLTDIYGLVASESREIQTAGFNLLHRAIPAAQEQLSLDALLEKKQAKLPDELTSLLLDAPTLEAYPEDELVQFPTPIRSYLLSWKLVFDAFQGAANKVRADYCEDLKTSGAIGPLMDFMFDVLGHSAANPINIDREGLTAEDIQSYSVSIADGLPDEKNMHWLLIHLFYLTLKYAPGLFKSWFLDCRSKQTKIAIEPWMTKYFSPLIIRDTLAEVEGWSKSQEVSDAEENELIVKVHYVQREVTAAYPIDDGGDEQQAAISIRIKPNYPLEFVDVTEINRVACSERTWQSWLRITQGVITISNGAIIDGLSTFRRNVIGALKGQVECAICYSFIAVDKKMPDKKCAQCKNLFHRDCLFKWFNSANQNTCPLCRTRMDFVDKKKVSKSLRRPPVDGD